MGETHKDRLDMLYSLKELNPTSVPLNFYHHNPALPLTPSPLSVDESLELIRLSRSILAQAHRLMIAGGREITFGGRQEEIFAAGANSIVLGNYLTTAGREAHADLEMLKNMGLDIAQTVQDH